MILAIVMSIVKWAHIISQKFVADTYFKLVALLLVACFFVLVPFLLCYLKTERLLQKMCLLHVRKACKVNLQV